MHNSVPLNSVTPLSARLKEARTAAGLSSRALAEQIAKRYPGLNVSHSTIANFEKNAAAPSIDFIGAYALICDRPISWFLTKGAALTGVQYRHLTSKTSVKDRHQFECQSQYWLEAYMRLERRLDKRLKAIVRNPVDPEMTPRAAAEAVRNTLKLSDHLPVRSVIDVLEQFGIRVIEMPTTLAIDGFAARLGGDPVVVLNPSSANDRCRMNAAHELGHVLFGDCESSTQVTKAMDNRAFEFASYLLLPHSQLCDALAGQSALDLLRYKEDFGISMAAQILRGESAGLIPPRTARRLWIQFSRRGWRANEPGDVRPDRALRMETLLDRAISERTLSWSEAAAAMDVTVPQLKQRRDAAMGFAAEPDEEGGPVFKINAG